ncbi:MAG: hypothetical protein QOF61_2847 [Acidobacteriota bacterium]|nr:hypothetical protein [Acidobacteriota bacterium]
MRLIDFITLYLAVAAPCGVVFFLRRPAHAPSARTLARASAAGLLFPVALLVHALSHRSGKSDLSRPAASATHEAHVEESRHALVAALHNYEDRAREMAGRDGACAAEAAHSLLAIVERYAGLTLALACADPKGELAERETELARVAGRMGDDLEIAGRCVRRRNVSRLREHQAQARLELLHALAGLQDAFDASGRAHDSSSPAAQHMPAALLRVYERAFDLFLCLEDARGVQSLVRLLDATRARLYRHKDADARRASRHDSTGEASCKPHSSPTTSPSTSMPRPTQPQRPTPLSVRG